MARSTGIVLVATGISFTNEWVQTNNLNFKLAVAGGFTALLFDGIEQVSEQAAVGLAVLMFIAVMVTPLNGKSPAETLASLAVAQPTKRG